MSTLYLHIGTPKTGTTSIQNFLVANRKVLEQHGISYPDFGINYPGIEHHRNCHFLITTGYRDEEGNRIIEKEKEDFEKGFCMIEEYAKRFSKIILSDEGIWFPAVSSRPDFWTELKERLEIAGIDIKIIVYFRRQDLFAQSHWAQKVKEGAGYDFHEYLTLPTATEYPLDYYGYMNMLSSLFGKEALIIRVFEKGQFKGPENTIQSDFLNIFGLKLEDGFALEKEVYNTSLEGDYLELKRILNNLPEFHSNKHMLITKIRNVQDRQLFEYNSKKTTFFAPGEQQRFMEQYNEGNEKLAREYLGREDGKLFYDDIEDIPEYSIRQDELLKDAVLAFGLAVDALDRKDKEIEHQLLRMNELEEEIRALRKESREKDKELKESIKELTEMALLYRLRRKVRHIQGKDKDQQV